MVRPSHRLACVVLAIMGMILAGCRSGGTAPGDSTAARTDTPIVHPGSPRDRNKPADLSGRADLPIAQSSPSPGTAQALAQRADSYAAAFQHTHSSGPAKSPAGTDAAWPDPDAIGLTPRAGATDAAAFASPVGAEANTGAVADNTIATTSHVAPATQPAHTAQAAAPAPAGDDMAERFARRAADYPQDLSAQVDDELLKFLREQTVPDMQTLAGLPAEDRELLAALMDALTNFRNQLRAEGNVLLSRKIRPLVELGERLRSAAELSVPTVALCTRVRGYGQYDVIDPPRFAAGHSQSVVVYCEVENFLAQLSDQKQYETRLTEEIVLYEESSGLETWRDRKKTYVDVARVRRHDFFIPRVIALPANLTIGRYLLKVTIEDQQARHVAENTVPLDIVAG